MVDIEEDMRVEPAPEGGRKHYIKMNDMIRTAKKTGFSGLFCCSSGGICSRREWGIIAVIC